MQATLQQVLTFIDADNKANSRNSRGEFHDDIADYVYQPMADLSNFDARLLLGWLEEGTPHRNAQIAELLRDTILKHYNDAALKHDENVKARERAWRAA